MTRDKEAAFITYFDCTVAPDDNYGALAHAVQPFGASPAASVLSRIGDPGSVAKRRILGLIRGGRETGRNRSQSGVAGVACLRTYEDLDIETVRLDWRTYSFFFRILIPQVIPYSGNWRPIIIIGIDSLRGPAKSFPLFTRLSIARSTSSNWEENADDSSR